MAAGDKVIVVSVDALSYSGTTWLNLVLGSHGQSFTLGPPHRAWRLKDKGFKGANLVWGGRDTFWSGFDKTWDRSENFLVALARYRNCSHIIFDNPGPDFRKDIIDQPGITQKRMWYLRDARAITASFARKNPGKTYLETILPAGWFYPSYMQIKLPVDRAKHPVFYYEKCLENPKQFLAEVGPYLGLSYSDDALRFWDWDHHITSGNQGTIALVKMAKGLDVGGFGDREFYAERLESLKRDPLNGFIDDRWKTQLGRLDRFYFDVLMGAKHAELGYERDTFGTDEIRGLMAEHGARVESEHRAELPAGILDAYLARREGKFTTAPDLEERPLSRRLVRARDLTRRGGRVVLRLFRAGEDRLTPSGLVRGVGHKIRNRISPPKPPPPPEDFEAAFPGLLTPPRGTFYFDEVTPEIRSCFSPYVVRAIGALKRPRETILAPAHYNLYEAYGPDYAGKAPHRIVADPPQRYRELLKSVLAVPGVRFMTARDMVGYEPAQSEIICHVRHDVDGDIAAAMQQARIEASLGIQATYYILHTAPYYGLWKDTAFERHESMAKHYKEIQDLGHEVALHTDGLGLYRFQRTDGAKGVETELTWLRSIGLRISGSAAHNSAGIYGAENFAIFKGRPLSTMKPAGPKAVIHNGRAGLLQQLDEKKLGLTYEATDLFIQTKVPIQYFALRGANDWRHQYTNPDKIPGIPSDRWNVSSWLSQEEVVDHLEAGPRGLFAIFAVHPEFYGLRANHITSPPIDSETPATEGRTAFGWRGFEPGRISLRYSVTADGSERQSVVKINELGFADVPPACMQGLERRFVFLGKDNIATDQASVDYKLPQAFIRGLRRSSGKLWGATALSGMLTPMAVRIAWLNQLLETSKIEDVVISAGLSDLLTEAPSHLSRIWDLDPEQAAILLPDTLGSHDLNAIRNSEFLGSAAPNLSNAHTILAGELERGAGSELARRAASRLDQALASIAGQGLRATVLIEDCGENVGLDWLKLSPSQQLERAAATMAIFEPITRAHGCMLVNPYRVFHDYKGRASTHWKTGGQWSIHGHTLAARALSHAVLPQDPEAG